MDFTTQFNAAAQQAVLNALKSGSWTHHKWLADMVRQSVQAGLATPAVTEPEPRGHASHPAAAPDSALTAEPASPDSLDGHQPIVLQGFIRTSTSGYETYPVALPQPTEAPAEPAVESTAQLMELEVSAEPLALSEPEPKAEPDSFVSRSFDHVAGYPYRILVLDREKDHTRSRAVHFNRAPTQEEFDYEFRDYQAGTHNIYVNVWDEGSNDWGTITTDYVPYWNKEKPKETLKPCEEWPEGKTYRIRFWDPRVPGYNYVYFARKPSPYAVKQYHDTKHFAVVEQRPEGV